MENNDHSASDKVRYLYIFRPESIALIDTYVRLALDAALPEWCTLVIVAPTVGDVAIYLRGGTSIAVRESAKSPFGERESDLRSFTISGPAESDDAERMIRQIFAKPCNRIGSSLHVHLARGTVQEPVTDGLAEHEKLATRVVKFPTVRLEDVILPGTVKKQITQSLAFYRNKDVAIGEWGLGEIPGFHDKLTMAINFIGPSGTGKTMAAEAIARELDATLLIVDYALLESKYVGDTSKNIKDVFAVARRQRAVLFFDEADSFLGRRSQNVRDSYDVAVNNTRAVMLMELARFEGLAVFATNLVSNYDKAFRRRIREHIEFALPNKEARCKILRVHLPPRLPGLQELNVDFLGDHSEGLSGSDLANAVLKVCGYLCESKEETGLVPPATDEDFLRAFGEIRLGYKHIPEQPTVRELTPGHLLAMGVDGDDYPHPPATNEYTAEARGE